MQASDFYGGESPVNASTGGTGMEAPPEMKGAGSKPAHFWLIMVGLLVLARVLYEASAKEG